MGLVTTTYPNDHENRPAYCDHTPAGELDPHGHRIQSLVLELHDGRAYIRKAKS